MQLDAHGTARRIERAVQSIKNSTKLSDREKQKILAFDEFLTAKGIGEKRRLVYLLTLPRLRLLLRKSFGSASKQDMITLMAKLEHLNLEEWTKHTYRVVAKKFCQWLHGMEGDEYPSQVSWIHSRAVSNRRVLPEELLTTEDLQTMLKAAGKDPRDKAFIMTLWESGCRIGEILGLRVKHAVFDEYGVILRVSGKTGERRVRIVSSAPLISAWLTHHPDRDHPDAPLWVQSKDEAFTYDAARMMLRRRAKQAKIKKDVNPHMFRHSQASELANDLTEAQMNEYFGWRQGSKMPAIYVHLSGRNIDQKILEMKGVKKPERHEERVVKACTRCGHINPPNGRYCMKCALPLDLKAALEIEEKRKRADDTMSRLLGDPDIQALVVRKIKDLGLAEKL